MTKSDKYREHKKAIKADITLRPFLPSGNQQPASNELALYAFTQSALRELRAHTSTWAEASSAAKPVELQGREGNDQTRASPSEIMERRTSWPFHLAGDSGVCLFGHRAWLSWRFLALLELHTRRIDELPCLSKDLQACIEAARSSTEPMESISATAVEQILFDFFHDPMCNGINAFLNGTFIGWSIPMNVPFGIVVEKILLSGGDPLERHWVFRLDPSPPGQTKNPNQAFIRIGAGT